jgi:hypothetical protein
MFVEAMAGLLTARLLLLLPFPRLARILDVPNRRPPLPEGKEASLVRELQWAIEMASRHAPMKATCLIRGIAAYFMSRRRGIHATLWWGAASRESVLAAHVWVTAGTNGIVGHQTAGQFMSLVRFPRPAGDGVESGGLL